MEEIEYGEFLRLNGGKIVRYGEKQDIRVENNRYIDYSGEYEWETRIVKHSSNIIDLIEVGDYVNGEPVEQVTEFEITTTTEYLTNPKDIKSICTREQFENAEYKLDN